MELQLDKSATRPVELSAVRMQMNGGVMTVNLYKIGQSYYGGWNATELNYT